MLGFLTGDVSGSCRRSAHLKIRICTKFTPMYKSNEANRVIPVLRSVWSLLPQFPHDKMEMYVVMPNNQCLSSALRFLEGAREEILQLRKQSIRIPRQNKRRLNCNNNSSLAAAKNPKVFEAGVGW